MSKTFRPLIFIQLNEINFDLVERYLARVDLPGFRQLLQFRRLATFAEQNYNELEPWIQWASVNSGRTFSEHTIFRLGDSVRSRIPQIFEVLEEGGLRVGAVSPMNARNDLKRAAYFIPDPWTSTPADSSGFSRRLAEMLRQTVNENAQGRITVRSLLAIAEAMVRTFDLRLTSRLLQLIVKAGGRRWYRALVLDQLIHMVHLHLVRAKRPDVSFVFFNAGAHIQHHYLFNSPLVEAPDRNPDWYVSPSQDPVFDMIVAYDRMLTDYMRLCGGDDARLIVATGLSQIPYDQIKYYYRLKNHTEFLRSLTIEPAEVLPRMTRDFEVIFLSREAAQHAAAVLASARMVRDGVALFGEIEDRGLSLFVTLTYPFEIGKDDSVVSEAGSLNRLHEHVVFVALKNGKHCSKGYGFLSAGVGINVPVQPVHVASLFDLTLRAAGVAGTELNPVGSATSSARQAA